MLRKRLSHLAGLGFATLLLLVQMDSALAVATAPPLGTTVPFAVLGGSTITNTGFSHIRGDLGLSPGTAVTGFPPGIVVPPGTAHVADAVATGAQNDATTAYNNLAGQACDFGPFGPTDLAGQSLIPGVYCFSSSVQNSGLLTLNGLPTDVWVFRVASSLTTGPGSSMVGGDKCNVFWQVGSSATLDTTTTFTGTIIALQSISLNNGVVLNGRALARNGAVTLINDTIDATGCAGVPPPGGVGLIKFFNPAPVNVGGTSTLTITLANTNAGVATLTAPLTDTFAAGLVVAGTPAVATTCGGGGAPTATPGGSSVTLPIGSTIPGGSIATPGFCTVTVNVTSTIAGCYLNTLAVGALATDLGSNAVSPTAVSVCFTTAAGIPTLSEWAMIALTLLLAFAGFAAMRRRNS